MKRNYCTCAGPALKIWLIAALVALSMPAFALHPLITDDAVMQTKGVFELELNYQYGDDRYREISRDPEELMESHFEGQSVFGKRRVIEQAHQAGVGLAYGIIDVLDLAAAIPYQSAHTRERLLFYSGPLRGLTWKESELVNGLGDITVELKWKFFEYKILSMALKPGAIIPTGNYNTGLGAGRFGGYAYFITTLDLNMVLLHLNLGYLRNENRLNEREDLWHASLAGEFWVIKDRFRFVANIGLDRNRDKRTNVHDAYLLAGMIVSPSESCDLDIGFKYSIQGKEWESPGPDYTVLAGATIWFGWVPKAAAVKDTEEGKGGK